MGIDIIRKWENILDHQNLKKDFSCLLIRLLPVFWSLISDSYPCLDTHTHLTMLLKWPCRMGPRAITTLVQTCPEIRQKLDQVIHFPQWTSPYMLWLVCRVCLLSQVGCYASMNKKIYAMGGGSYGKLFDSVECFDPKTQHWTGLCPLKERR